MASGTGSGTARRRRPRLRTVLLVVNLLILLLPLAGIALLRLYENELIRGTEAQLLAQAGLLREVFHTEYVRAAGSPPPPAPAARRDPAVPRVVDPAVVLAPMLDIVARDEILPPAAAATAPDRKPDPVAASAGASTLPMLEAVATETLVGIRIVDGSGIVVATTGAEAGLSLGHREEVARALRGEPVSILRQRVSDEPIPPFPSLSRGQRYRIFVALPVEDGDRVLGAVVASRTPLDIAKALYLNRRPILIGLAGLLAVVVLVSALTAVTILRPARALTELGDRVARGERGVALEIGEPGTREMARLAESIASMARTLEHRAEYIRTFASHVSHEFKTPLATIRGTVELLRDHLPTMTPEERDRFVHILEDSSDRLDRLVRRLLELARADVMQPAGERTPVAKALEDVAARHRVAGPNVTVECQSDVGEIPMAPDTLAEILSNLLDNARLHGGSGVRVTLRARLDRSAAPPEVELVVSDDGPGVSESNAARIFTPFFTTARDRGGSGLGLTIVRSLLAGHGGTIRLEHVGGPGATFVVRIPAAPDRGADA